MSQINTFTDLCAMRSVFRRRKKVFFVGICGIGMQGIARLLADGGYTVAGSDISAADCPALAGIPVIHRHAPENIRGYEIVVYSLATDTSTPEMIAARRAAIPCFSRADVLGMLMAGYRRRIAVAGMHGKTTVTAMLAAALADATVVSGGSIGQSGLPVRIGKDDTFLAEACEYKDSFLCLYPTVALVLNCEWEHTDYFQSFSHVKASFHTFMRRAETVILPSDCPRDRLPRTDGMRVLRFGTSPYADARAENIVWQNGCAAFDYSFCGIARGRVTLAVPGEHNLANALAALAVAEVCRLPFERTAAALASFSGADRRLTHRGFLQGASVYEDYAHHPTEICASLSALRRMTKGRLLCLFQPHTYSRTKAFFADFVKSFALADRVGVLDIYAAREKDPGDVHARDLAAAAENAQYLPNAAAAVALLRRLCRSGDTLVIMGAGDIGRQIFSALPLSSCNLETNVVE